MVKGQLYIVPTPIGNLKDITLRALDVLKSVDIIAAEDTRQSIKLLNHYNIKKKLISYHQHNEQGKSEDIVELLKQGNNIALVSDAGTPAISDPGSVVVKRCIDANIKYEVLPGATALIPALIYSGLDTTKFLFRGFLPKDNKLKKEVIEEIKDCQETIIIYEAPHRLLNTLKFLKENLNNRRISIIREISKLHEEVHRFTLEEAIDYYNYNPTKGEYVIVIEGKSKEELEKEELDQWKELSISEHILFYIEGGMSKKEAIKKVAQDRKMPKSEIYKYSIDIN